MRIRPRLWQHLPSISNYQTLDNNEGMVMIDITDPSNIALGFVIYIGTHPPLDADGYMRMYSDRDEDDFGEP